MDLGSLPKIPNWVFILFMWLAIIGIVAVFSGAIYGILSLSHHISWN